MIQNLLSSDLAWRLGWTLLHSLWQISLVGAVTGLLLMLLSRHTANLRYLVACGGMVAMVVPLLFTFALVPPRTADEVVIVLDEARVGPTKFDEVSTSTPTESSRSESPATMRMHSVAASTSIAQDSSKRPEARGPRDASWRLRRLSQVASTCVPWTVGAWLVGAGLISLWNLGGWFVAHRLRKLATVSAGKQTKDRLTRLAKQMHVSRPVRLLESMLVEVPMVIGWLRPVLLLPASLVTGLSPDDLDALLAHELAHIRRHDYLVNLLQTLTETLLFYHPAVWLVSRRIRIEREYCCDDAAIVACGGKIQYARALAAVECRRAAPGFAMSIFGRRKTMTLSRVHRILGVPPTGRSVWFTGSGAFSLLTVLLLGLAVFLTESDSPVAAQASQRRAIRDAGQQTRSTAKALAEKPTEPDRGKAVRGLQTRLSADKKNFAAGHPILMKLEITNVGDEVRQYAAYHRMINNGLVVTDANGRAVPYVGGTSQIREKLVKIEPGQTQVLESFNLAAGYYLRRPGRYTVSFPGMVTFPGAPPSNKLHFEVTSDPAATADGDPVGCLLPLVQGDWSLVGAPDATGKIRPGANRQEMPGRTIVFQYNPTGAIREIRLIMLWLTDKPADEIENVESGWPPSSEYLGQVSRWHVYVHAPPKALKRWPKAKEEIKLALNKAQIQNHAKKEKTIAGRASIEKPWRIRLTSPSKAVVFNTDGTRQSEKKLVDARTKFPSSQLSPDGSEFVYVDHADGDHEIFIADADGKNSRKLTDNDANDRFPTWSPDGQRIAFSSWRAGVWQIYVMDRDGKNLKKLTDEVRGARNPKFGPDGRLAYLAPQGAPKLQPVNLVVAGNKESQAIVSGIFISTFSWSPDGNTIAYSTLGSLVFHQLKTGKRKEVAFTNIDKRLGSHTAHRIFWRPDSRAVACSIVFLGGRKARRGGDPAPIFGDDELFTIGVDGKATWFKPGKEFMPYGLPTVDWLRGDEK